MTAGEKYLATSRVAGLVSCAKEVLNPQEETGKLTEKVSTTEFKKEFSDASLPLNMGYKLTTTLKEGVTIDKLKAEGTMNYLLPFPTVWIDGGVRYTASVIPKSGEKVAERFEAGSFNKSYYESVNEKGSGTTGTWK